MFRDILDSLTTLVDIQRSGHWLAEGIIFVLFCIIIVIIVTFWGKIKIFFENDKLSFTIFTSIFFIIIALALIEKLCVPSLNILGQSTFVSLISISGILATLVGLVIAYRQLRLSEDRIDSYERLYERLNDKLRQAIKQSKTKEIPPYFQFYGGTLIPGNIAYGGKGKDEANKHIEEYKKNLKSLKELAKKLEGKFEIILPSDKKLKTTYAPYGSKPDIDIDKTIDEVIKLKNEINEDCCITEVTEDIGLQILSCYYFAIGNTIIYATALHYQIILIAEIYGVQLENEKKHKPLLGFVTSNPKILRESRDIFDDFKKVLTKQREILNSMYSKHLLDVNYIDRKLELKGYSRDNIGSKEYLYSIDQDHFSKLAGTIKCIEQISIEKTDRVLDIGGGFGGPARYIADKIGSRVWSIEIQKDRYDLSKHLTRNLGLEDKITTINGDFVAHSFEEGTTYTKVIAFLSILHIIKKDLAIQKISRLLELEGKVYIEDYYKDRGLTKNEEKKLSKTVSCSGLLTKEDYLKKLEENNIEIISCEDLTNDWKEEAMKRSEDMERNKEEIIGWYKDRDKVEKAVEFAKEVSKLFNDGVIHGFRIVGRKK